MAVVKFRFNAKHDYKLDLRPKPRVVPLTPELFSLALATETDPIVRDQALTPELVRSIMMPGLGFAVLDGGVLVCALGARPIVYGRLNAWMIATPLATRRHLVFATRETRRYFDRWSVDPAFRRIEMQVMDGSPWRESFARALGMNEGPYLMRKWDEAGRDWWLYAKVSDA